MIIEMVMLGYPLPLNKIIDLLESCDYISFADTIRQLIKL